MNCAGTIQNPNAITPWGNSSKCEIKHIAVLADQRGKGIGSRRYVFFITSQGEKYPGVERFLCQYNKQ